MSLLDEIKKRLAAPAAGPMPGAAAAEQAGIQEMLRARSGKAAPSQAPTASAVAAETAAAAGATGLRELNLAGQQAAARLGATEEQQTAQTALAKQQLQTATEQGTKDIATLRSEAAAGRQTTRQLFDVQQTSKTRQTVNEIQAAADKALANLASERKITSDDLWASFQQGNQDLAFRKDSAQLEQMAFTMALADKKYIQELEQIGALRRLENESNFRKELEGLVLDEQTKALITGQDWERLNQADIRAWEEAMANINIDAALAIATSKTKTATAGHYVEGGGQLAKAAAGGKWGGQEEEQSVPMGGGSAAVPAIGGGSGSAKGGKTQSAVN